MARRGLGIEGFDVRVAAGGAQALAVLDEFPADVVVLLVAGSVALAISKLRRAGVLAPAGRRKRLISILSPAQLDSGH